MNTIAKIATGAILAVGLSTSAMADTVINFDDVGASGLIGGFYHSFGVDFSNAEFAANFSLSGTSPPTGVRAPGTYVFGLNNAVAGVFTGTASSVSIRGIDVGEAGIRLEAYDASNVLLGFDQFIGVGIGVGTFADLVVNAAGIKSFKFAQAGPCCGDGVVFDDLSFSSGGVPEPAAWGLMILGFGGVGASIRRRRTAASAA